MNLRTVEITLTELRVFWAFCKHRLSKIKGIKRDNFLLHLKECEFRFNNQENLYQILLKLIRENPIKLNKVEYDIWNDA